jgi:hypothetical protein
VRRRRIVPLCTAAEPVLQPSKPRCDAADAGVGLRRAGPGQPGFRPYGRHGQAPGTHSPRPARYLFHVMSNGHVRAKWGMRLDSLYSLSSSTRMRTSPPPGAAACLYALMPEVKLAEQRRLHSWYQPALSPRDYANVSQLTGASSIVRQRLPLLTQKRAANASRPPDCPGRH